MADVSSASLPEASPDYAPPLYSVPDLDVSGVNIPESGEMKACIHSADIPLMCLSYLALEAAPSASLAQFLKGHVASTPGDNG